MWPNHPPPTILVVHSSPGKALLLEIQTLEAGLLFSSSSTSTTFPGSNCSLESFSDVTLLSIVLHARRMNTLLQTVPFPLQGSFIQFPRSLGPVPHGLQRGNT